MRHFEIHRSGIPTLATWAELMCEIVILIVGIIALIRGRFLFARVKEVRGWPARIIGILLIAPYPLSVLLGIVLGAIFLALGKKINNEEFESTVQVVGYAALLICLLAAIVVATLFAQPIRKPRPEPMESVLPDDYNKRFQARADEEFESQDIAEGASRPAALPDDRIQH